MLLPDNKVRPVNGPISIGIALVELSPCVEWKIGEPNGKVAVVNLSAAIEIAGGDRRYWLQSQRQNVT